MTSQSFHNVRFPLDIALGAVGGPRRNTEIVSLVSGHEKRNTRWADARRNYNAGFGVKTLDDLHQVLSFFESRRGRLFAFRFRDPIDFKSCLPSHLPNSSDQDLGIGDGVNAVFQLAKTYSDSAGETRREITKPTAGSVVVAIDGVQQTLETDFVLDAMIGEITFLPGSIPGQDMVVSAGFEFDVPVRFETDEISISLAAFQAGDVPSIPLVEVKA